MSELANNPAIAAADMAQQQIDACLDAARSFRLEAGAGAGKTYSLVAALKRIIAERGRYFQQAGKKVACITFTEVARKEIAQEVEDHPAILVETIHSFSWAFMRPFQKALRELLGEVDSYREKLELGGGVGSKAVEYGFGYFGVDEEKITLDHDDIPRFMAELLSKEKFRRILAQKFPIIFIDEYQDTDRDFMKAIKEVFLNKNEGPLVGLFGDHWQTIYRSEYELADYPIVEIGKGSNFRSVPAIVNVLNKIRPELLQEVSDPVAVGEARFFHTNAYTGPRTDEKSSKGDLPAVLATTVREQLFERLCGEGWDRNRTKVLVLTHNVLAAEQGYPNIAEIFRGRSERYAKMEDAAIRLFVEMVEPICAAYADSQYGEIFRILKASPGIRKHADKAAWRRDMDRLIELRAEGTIGQVIDHLRATRRPPLPSRVLKRDDEFLAFNGREIPEEEAGLMRYAMLRNVRYSEVSELARFIEGMTPFATQHSVKGAEFENVLVVLGGGWSNYNWPQLFELLQTRAINTKNAKGFYRARNLFYVSISRPMKRLAVLATQQISATGMASIEALFGAANVESLNLT